MGGLDTLPLPDFMYNTIYNKDCTITMKIQDKQKNDEFLTGISGTYHSIGDNSFFVNLTCVWADNHVISSGKSYALFDYPAGNGIHGTPVKLLGVLMNDHVIYMTILDMLTGEVLKRSHCMNNAESNCTWLLLDLDYFQTISDWRTIISYCEKDRPS
jgi:hypothetical protein